MKKRVISFMMSAVLTLSGLGCYGLANVHAETDTNVERKLKIFAHYAEAEAALEKKHEEMLAAGEEIPEDEEVVVDMSGFEATPEMLEKQEEAKAMYANVGAELKKSIRC